MLQNKCDVIIVTYNSKADIARCLSSIIKYSSKDIGKIIVVDNASQDATHDILQRFNDEQFKLDLVINNVNLGFSKANNQGITFSDSEYLLFLNPDTVLNMDVIGNLNNRMRENHAIGVIGPALLRPDGSIQGGFGKMPTLQSTIFEFIRSGRRWSPLGFAKKINNDLETDWVSGGCLFSRTALVKTIGGFDENIFMYAEDVDLCLRIKELGYKVLYVPDQSIVHFGGSSQRQNREKSLIANIQSRMYILQKYYSTKKAVQLRRFLLVFVFIKMIISCILCLFGSRYSSIAKAYKEALLYLVNRKPVQETR